MLLSSDWLSLWKLRELLRQERENSKSGLFVRTLCQTRDLSLPLCTLLEKKYFQSEFDPLPSRTCYAKRLSPGGKSICSWIWKQFETIWFWKHGFDYWLHIGKHCFLCQIALLSNIINLNIDILAMIDCIACKEKKDVFLSIFLILNILRSWKINNPLARLMEHGYLKGRVLWW